MAGRVSAEMKEALRLIKDKGLTAYAASKKTGITRQAISMNREYRAYIATLKGKSNV